MGVLIRLERKKRNGVVMNSITNLLAYDIIVRSGRGIRGGFLENIGSFRLFGAYKILHIKKERLAYWLHEGALCSERLLKELIKNGVTR